MAFRFLQAPSPPTSTGAAICRIQFALVDQPARRRRLARQRPGTFSKK
jgi:hypothetical protein